MTTAAQQTALNDLKNLFSIEEDIYNSRSYMRLDIDEFVEIPRRITLTYKDVQTYTSVDEEGNEQTYSTHREEEFFYTVWFNREGHIWFLISESCFPQFGVDIPYWADREDYDYKVCGRGSRRYFFGDIIQDSVEQAFATKLNNLKSHYVWRHAEMRVIKYKEKNKFV